MARFPRTEAEVIALAEAKMNGGWQWKRYFISIRKIISLNTIFLMLVMCIAKTPRREEGKEKKSPWRRLLNPSTLLRAGEKENPQHKVGS